MNKGKHHLLLGAWKSSREKPKVIKTEQRSLNYDERQQIGGTKLSRLSIKALDISHTTEALSKIGESDKRAGNVKRRDGTIQSEKTLKRGKGKRSIEESTLRIVLYLQWIKMSEDGRLRNAESSLLTFFWIWGFFFFYLSFLLPFPAIFYIAILQWGREIESRNFLKEWGFFIFILKRKKKKENKNTIFHVFFLCLINKIL